MKIVLKPIVHIATISGVPFSNAVKTRCSLLIPYDEERWTAAATNAISDSVHTRLAFVWAYPMYPRREVSEIISSHICRVWRAFGSESFTRPRISFEKVWNHL